MMMMMMMMVVVVMMSKRHSGGFSRFAGLSFFVMKLADMAVWETFSARG